VDFGTSEDGESFFFIRIQLDSRERAVMKKRDNKNEILSVLFLFCCFSLLFVGCCPSRLVGKQMDGDLECGHN
jgi:hypothetical protein